MGQVEVVQNNKFFHQQPMKVEINFGNKVMPHYMPVINWSLTKVRNFYDSFKLICGPDHFFKYVTLRTFQELLKDTFHPSLSKQLFLIIFRIFDFDLNGNLTIDEMILIFLNTVKSLCTLTGTYDLLPKEKHKLVQAGQKIFKQADVDNSDSLSVEEIKHWVESRKVFVEFIERFEPKTKIYYEPWIYQNFPEIKISELRKDPLNTMGTLDKFMKETFSIKQKQRRKVFADSTENHQMFATTQNFMKSKNNPDLNEGDTKQFPTILDKIQRNQSHIKLSTLKSQSTIDYKGGLNLLKHVSLFSNGDFMPNPPNRLKSKRPSMNFNLKILTQQQQQEVKDQQKLNVEDVNLLQTTMDQRLIKNMQDSALLTARLERNKSQANIRKKQLLQIQPINTHRQSVQRVDEYGIQSMKQGKTYSKNDIIELKRFYDIMDRESKGYITYEDYSRNFKLMSNSQKHAKNVFETLDKQKKGQISLEQFVRVSIPQISDRELKIVFKWMQQPNKYNEGFFLQSTQRPPTQAITNNSPDKFKQFTQNLMLAPSPTKLPGTQTVNTSNPLSPTLPQNQFHVQSQNQLKVIPKQNVKEFLRIFDIYNKDKSGQMSIQDLRKFLLDTYQRDDLVDGFLLRKNITISLYYCATRWVYFYECNEQDKEKLYKKDKVISTKAYRRYETKNQGGLNQSGILKKENNNQTRRQNTKSIPVVIFDEDKNQNLLDKI
eukprot:403368282